MGIVSLFSRKFGSEKKQPQIRAPPFESKISTKSPVRLVSVTCGDDSYSVVPPSPRPQFATRNLWSSDGPASPTGSALSPTATSFRREDSSSRLSIRPSTASRPSSRLSLFSPAPREAPVVDNVRRPSHATLCSMTSGKFDRYEARPMSSGVASGPGGPSGRKMSTYSTLSTLSTGTASRGHVDLLEAASAGRKFSAVSLGRGHVDLLDAQAEIKALDFYGRIKASGARDYGEDVADRNMAATTATTTQAPQSRKASYSVAPRPPAISEEEETRAAAARQKSLESEAWLKTVSAQQGQQGQQSPSQSEAQSKRRRVVRRQTMQLSPGVDDFGSFDDFDEDLSTPTLAELHKMMEQQRQADAARAAAKAAKAAKTVKAARRHSSLQLTASDASRMIDAWDAQLNAAEHQGERQVERQGDRRPATSGGSPSRSTGGLRRTLSSRAARKHIFSSILELDDGVVGAGDAGDAEDVVQYAVNTQPVLSPQPSSFQLSASLASAAIQSDAWSDDEHGDRASAPSPCIKTSRSRSRSRASSGATFDEQDSRSFSTPQPRALDEEHTPGLTSSTRHWSLSSSTPTMSLTSGSEYSGRVLHAASLENLENLENMENMQESEQDLLFGRGYGLDGMQLPGLEASFSGAAKASTLSTPGHATPSLRGIAVSPRRSSRKAKTSVVGAVAVADFETCVDFDRLALASECGLLAPAYPAFDGDYDDDVLGPSLDISRHRPEHTRPASPTSPTSPTSPASPASPASAHARRAETKRLTAIYAPAVASSSSRSVLRYADVIEEERGEAEASAAATDGRRASVMSISKQTAGRGLVKTISIEGRRASVQRTPNILDVPELTADQSE